MYINFQKQISLQVVSKIVGLVETRKSKVMPWSQATADPSVKSLRNRDKLYKKWTICLIAQDINQQVLKRGKKCKKS